MMSILIDRNSLKKIMNFSHFIPIKEAVIEGKTLKRALYLKQVLSDEYYFNFITIFIKIYN